jgi:hypothetical protein
MERIAMLSCCIIDPMQAKERFLPFHKSHVDKELLSPMFPVLKNLTEACQVFLNDIANDDRKKQKAIDAFGRKQAIL